MGGPAHEQWPLSTTCSGTPTDLHLIPQSRRNPEIVRHRSPGYTSSFVIDPQHVELPATDRRADAVWRIARQVARKWDRYQQFPMQTCHHLIECRRHMLVGKRASITTTDRKKGILSTLYSNLPTRSTALWPCLPRSDFRSKTDQIEEASL